MDVGFEEHQIVWPVPDGAFAEVISELRGIGHTLTADVLEISLMEGALAVGIDDRELPAFRSAVRAYASRLPFVPDWALEIVEETPRPGS